MKKKDSSIVWFREDLRINDNPALVAASKLGRAIVPLYIWHADRSDQWAMGAASKWWLHQSLISLDESLQRVGSRLIIRKGDFLETLIQVIRATNASAVFWNRSHEPTLRTTDANIGKTLNQLNIKVNTFNGSWLFDPEHLVNKSGKAYQVFTPFWNHCLTDEKPDKPLPAPTIIPSPRSRPTSVPLQKLDLNPKIDWAAAFRDFWTPGEYGATQRFRVFLKDGLANYQTDRDRPDLNGSSRLSPHLHFGEISPRQVWYQLEAEMLSEKDKTFCHQAQSFLRQLGWREFASHLLYHFPYAATHPLRAKFEKFPWKSKEAHLRAWQKGRTGYPIVDAGMRELWATGWMHNRARMIVASFLTKHLQITWQRGAEWFWDTLVDADLANNTLGWQWVTGCGADAAPYFRIFNPVSQGIKFDPMGQYVRRWVPELALLPYPWIHKPWEAPSLVLKEGGVKLGRTYPHPIVDHRKARESALRSFAALSPGKSTRTREPVVRSHHFRSYSAK